MSRESRTRRVFDPFSSFSSISSFLPRRPSFPALVRATSTLDLEHVLHTTRHFAVEESDVPRRACARARARAYAFGLLARSLAFFLAYVRLPAHRDVSSYTRAGEGNEGGGD